MTAFFKLCIVESLKATVFLKYPKNKISYQHLWFCSIFRVYPLRNQKKNLWFICACRTFYFSPTIFLLLILLIQLGFFTHLIVFRQDYETLAVISTKKNHFWHSLINYFFVFFFFTDSLLFVVFSAVSITRTPRLMSIWNRVKLFLYISWKKKYFFEE